MVAGLSSKYKVYPCSMAEEEEEKEEKEAEEKPARVVQKPRRSSCCPIR